MGNWHSNPTYRGYNCNHSQLVGGPPCSESVDPELRPKKFRNFQVPSIFRVQGRLVFGRLSHKHRFLSIFRSNLYHVKDGNSHFTTSLKAYQPNHKLLNERWNGLRFGAHHLSKSSSRLRWFVHVFIFR